jgi:twitching motility protein PilT
MPTISGVFYVLRRLPSSVPDLNSLGLHPGIVKRLMLPKLKGLVLIAGATGSGKSTTAGALVKHRMHTLGGVCVTVEDPPEMPLAGRNGKGLCYQVEAERGDFATPCRSILRWAPDIIFLGEIRDAASAVEAVRASINGHLVIGTIHADNVISTVERIYGMISGVSPNDAGSMLANGLMAVLHQSLSRQKGVARAFLKTEWLFFAGREGEAPRTNVRERNFKMLVSHIEAQERRLVRNIETDLNQF